VPQGSAWSAGRRGGGEGNTMHGIGVPVETRLSCFYPLNFFEMETRATAFE
jgi:hypothetical protein